MFLNARSIRHSVIYMLAAIALTACASPAKLQNMVVAPATIDSVTPNSAFKDAITVSLVGGGKKTNPMWTSQVDNAAFQGALTASLKQSQLLAPEATASRFDLSANIASLNQPMFGLDMRVGSSVNYRVVERQTDLLWYDELVSASYTATFSDSALGIERLRLANEGSIRENIKEFITQLSKTSPPAGTTDISTTEKSLLELRKLLDDGLINKEEYELRRQKILDDF